MLNKQKFHIFLRWLLVFLWMFLIFCLSGQTANQSDKLSSGVTEFVIKIVKLVTHQDEFNLSFFNHIIRKCAHFSIYFVLALFVLNAVRQGKQLDVKKFILSLVICALYASSDEFHQSFVSGRGPQVKDVFIDSAGSAVGMGFYFALTKIRWKKRNKIHATKL